MGKPYASTHKNDNSHVGMMHLLVNHTFRYTYIFFRDTNTCDEPVTILKDFARRHHRGRKLDLQSDSDFLEGETNELFILRSQIFDDAMEEILRESPPIDYSLPLEVTFTGEGAQDYGGPRREFLGLVLRQIQDRLFKEEEEDGYVLLEKQESIGNNHYFGAGLFFGKCSMTSAQLYAIWCNIVQTLRNIVHSKM